MPWFLIACVVVTLLVLFYAFFLRDWILRRVVRSQPQAILETTTAAVEESFWHKSRTILISRLYWVGGIIVALHDALAASGLDWTPLITQATWFIPEPLRPYTLSVIFIITGWMFEWLRKTTTTPLPTASTTEAPILEPEEQPPP